MNGLKQILNKENIQRSAFFLALLLPATIMLTIFIIKGIYPFGDRSFLFADLYHQYMPFFSELLHKVRGGETLNFSFKLGIGSNFLALFGYYLASPFHILALLVPEDYLIEFISYLIVLKIGLAGMTSFLYLQRHFQTKDGSALFFSCFYALSGFMAAYNYNIMWIDCVVLLPLIVLGLELLVKEGRCGLYCVTLALSIFTNFYISIMVCIFLVLYFIVLLIIERNRLRSIGYFALFSLLAGGMAAILLIPEVCALLETDFGDMDFPKTVESYFPVLDMLARHCMCVNTERGLDHWPNIYCGSAVLMLMPMYLMNKKISIREKFCRLVLLGFILLSFSMNFLDFIWHGLNYPDSLPARQSFIYIFLVLAMCYDAWLHVYEADEQQILYGYLCAVGFFLFCEKFIAHEDFYLGVKILTLIFVSIYAVLLYIYRTRSREKIHLIVAVVTLVAVTAECGINTYNTSVGTVSRSQYLGQEEDYRSLYEMTKEREDGLYRLEKFTRRTNNDGTLTGYPTASTFSSTMNSYVMDMYRLLGMRCSKVFYCFEGATALVSAMLNVNYMFGESDRYENGLYTLIGQSGDIYLYQSNAALPFGYVAPVGYDLSDAYENHGLHLQNEMVKDLGIRGDVLFKRVNKKTAGDDILFTAGQAGYYYGIVTAWGTSKAECIYGNEEKESYKDLRLGSVLYLGYLEEEETITLKNADENDTTPQMSIDVYRMNEDVLNQALEKLSEQHMENVVWESDYIEGDIELAEPGRVIFSVPYEDGWTVLVNGEEREGVLFGGCLMAYDLEEGTYHFEMKYVPEGAYAGIIVSVCSILLFIGIQLLRRNRSASHIGKRNADCPKITG